MVFSLCVILSHSLQVEMEAKDIQLQQKDTQLQQIQQQGTELQEKTLQLNRQLTEVQTLRVRKLVFYCRKGSDSIRALVIRRTRKACKQRLKLRMLRLTCRGESYRH